MKKSRNHLNIESLESRTLFAGVQEALELSTVDAQAEVIECEGVVRHAGEALVAIGSSMEVPGKIVESMGEGLYIFFAEAPEYPHNGVYTGVSVEVLDLAGKSVSILGLIPSIAGTGISYVGMFGEMLGDDGYGYDYTTSNAIHDIGSDIASLGEGITQWGMDFSEGQRYAPSYQDFIAEHEDHWMTIAGTTAGTLVSGLGFVAKLPGLAVHKTGDLTVTTCNLAQAASEVLGSACAQASDFYVHYLGSDAKVSV